MSRAALRALVVGLVLAVLGGCGVKSLYNNLDRLIYWGIDDWVQMDEAQERYLKGELDAFLYWHRTTQLPLYARGIERVEREIASGLSVEDLMTIEEMVKVWTDAVVAATIPLSAELLYSLHDEQLAELGERFTKSNEKLLKPYKGLDLDERRERWAEDFGDSFENFVGSVTAEQRALVATYAARYQPDDAAWLDYRKRWEQDLIELIRKRDGYTAFELAFKDMAVNRERWYGDEYRSLFEGNEMLYRNLTIDVLKLLNDQQHKALSEKLLSYAQDFDELAAEAPPVPPPPPCLVTC